MDEVTYLTVEMILDVYAIVMGCPVEQAPYHLRAPEVLASAAAKPANWAYYASGSMWIDR